MVKHYRLLLTLAIGLLLLSGAQVSANSSYGSGAYGSCQYGGCSITVSSSGTVNLALTSIPGGSCTVQSDSVSVLTDNSDGYTLTVSALGPNTDLVSGSSTINASSGTFASPTALSLGKWGYRIDSGSFGSGPTTAQTNVSPSSISSLTFAGMVNSNQTPVTLANTSSPADPAQSTLVWYGACIDVTQPQGTYSALVNYTAITN